MKDELKNVISQAMNSNSEFGQEPTTQFDGELSDEALNAVAGGCYCKCSYKHNPCKHSHCKYSYRKY